MNRDKQFIRSIKNPRDNQNSKYNHDEYLVVDIVKLGNHDFFKVMLEFDADINVQSKNKIPINDKEFIDPNSSLFQIAYKLKNKKILELIQAKLNKEHVTILNSIKSKDIFYKMVTGDLKNTPPDEILQPLILLDPAMMIPYDLCSSFNFNVKDTIDNYPEIAEERWHIIYGAYMPFLNYKKETYFVPLILKIVDWIQKYPKTISIVQTVDK